MTGIIRPVRYLSLLLSTLAPIVVAGASCEQDGDDSTRRQAEQKFVLLQRLVTDSDPVRRVERSGNAAAQAAIEEARLAAAATRDALDADCISLASDLSANGLKLASQAFRSAANTDSQGKEEYAALHQQTVSFLEALLSQPVESRGIDEDGITGMRRQISKAENLALDGSFDDAARQLGPVADRLQRRLIQILDQVTVYYEKDLSGPREEYAYVLQQYRGYRLLLDGGTRQTSYSMQKMLQQSLQQATTLSEQAQLLADKEDWVAALDLMTNAVQACERAVRAAGYTH